MLNNLKNLAQNKPLLIAAGVILVVAFMIFLPSSVNNSQTSRTAPSTISERGEDVAQEYFGDIKDFPADESRRLNEPQRTLYLVETEQFAITQNEDESYLITILSKPASVSIERAEQEFLDVLGLSYQQACTLEVVIAVPAFVSANNTPETLGLSFCN